MGIMLTYLFHYFAAGSKLNLPMHVYGPETHMTAVVGMALGQRPIIKVKPDPHLLGGVKNVRQLHLFSSAYCVGTCAYQITITVTLVASAVLLSYSLRIYDYRCMHTLEFTLLIKS